MDIVMVYLIVTAQDQPTGRSVTRVLEFSDRDSADGAYFSLRQDESTDSLRMIIGNEFRSYDAHSNSAERALTDDDLRTSALEM